LRLAIATAVVVTTVVAAARLGAPMAGRIRGRGARRDCRGAPGRPVSTDRAADAEFLTVSLTHAGRERPYLLRVPTRHRAERAPLVLQLHGRGIDPVTFDQWTGFSNLADSEGFALTMPSAVGEIWNDGRYRGDGWDEIHARDDVGYLVAVIDDACVRLPIDPSRVYVVGMSNGAPMAARLACEHAERFAAIAQVSGTAAMDVAAGCRPQVPVPILQIHGSSDRYAPYAGGRARGLRARLFLRHPAGPCVGVDAWAQQWVDANDAHDGPRAEVLPPDTTIRRWTGRSPRSDVAFYRIEDGGHTWPGNRAWVPPFFGRTSRAFDATTVIWAFFAAHARER
jgi:polyhydroxybutyrate depolymerase